MFKRRPSRSVVTVSDWNVVVTAPQEPNVNAKAQGELVVPLVHQVDGGGDDQRGPACPLDGHVGEVSLAGPRRQDDDAAARPRSTRLPRPLDLVRKGGFGHQQPLSRVSS